MDALVNAIEKISEKNIIDYLLIIVPIVISLLAIVVSVSTARRQNKIAMFELRYKALSTIKRILNFASTFDVTTNSRIVIESFNCCFSTHLDENDKIRSLVNASIKKREIEENIAIVSSMLRICDQKIIVAAFAKLSKIINSAIVGKVNECDVEDFKALSIMLDKITIQRLERKIIGSGWCFKYNDTYAEREKNNEYVNEGMVEK